MQAEPPRERTQLLRRVRLQVAAAGPAAPLAGHERVVHVDRHRSECGRYSPAVALELLTAASPGDPVLDVALSHALLLDVAAGRRPDALRIFRPGAAAAFGRLDAIRSQFPGAVAVARDLGLAPLVRSVGGHAAVFDERSLVVEHITREDDVTAGLQARFAAQSALLAGVLRALGADPVVGELAGEYCPGGHSIHAGGVKVVGIGQRAVRHAANTSAVVVVGGGARVREAVTRLYAALELDVDPATAGSLDELVPGATAGEVAARVRAAYGAAGLEPVEPGGALLARARELVPRHLT
jgi:octanoyl-[GcvH]:protein N-octanoyltransferase